jgi:DNA-binding transcriptional MerR regulator
MKRRGNRRYYQHHEVLMIRRIRDLLYDQGFTISGARNKLQEIVQVERDKRRAGEVMLDGVEVIEVEDSTLRRESSRTHAGRRARRRCPQKLQQLRRELFEIRDLLSSLATH